MQVKTRYFGEIDLDENKVISFENGLMGFEEYKKYTILYDVDGEKDASISWLQCIDEPGLAIPVVNPLMVKEDYNPYVEDEVLRPLGELTDDNLVVLLTLTVPSDITKTTANLKAPMIINSDTRKGCQIIVDNPDYEVKYNVYEVVHKLKAEKGED